MAQLFRKASLDKLSNPEQLDKAIVIMSPGNWLAILGAALMIVSALVWCMVGRIPVTESADGIYLAASPAGKVICYVPLATGKRITPGMAVRLSPSIYSSQEYGQLIATVAAVDDYVTSSAAMLEQLGDPSLVSLFAVHGSVIAVDCELTADPATASGYYWTSRKGANLRLANGTLVKASIIIAEKAPISLLIPALD